MTTLHKNIEQTVPVRARQLLGSKLSPEFVEAFTDYAKETDESTKEGFKVRALGLLDNQTVQELKFLDVEMPSGIVNLALSLGQLLYYIAVSHSSPPKSPFGKALWEKRFSEYAAELDKPEFAVPPEVKDLCFRAMSDEKMWEQTVAWPTFKTKQTENDKPVVRSLQLSTEGIGKFMELIGAAMAIVGPDERK